MLELVESQYRIQWDTFTVVDDFKVNMNIHKDILSVSNEALDMMIGYREWSGVRYQNDSGVMEIGYGIGDTDEAQGYTEAESYAEWIGYVRNRQKAFRDQLPIFSMPQSAFDALLSLYLDTGTWRQVEAEEGIYNLGKAVKNKNWLLCADIISRGKFNSQLRRKEATALMLGDYIVAKTRTRQRVDGIQKLRIKYVSGINTEFDKTQAEFVYYRQLDGLFLPGMSQLRKRRIVTQAR